MEDISFSSGHRAVRAALAAPDPEKFSPPWPGVVVLHELFGLTDDIRDYARKFADLGYLAIAPDLYSGGNKAACIARVVRSMATGEGESFADIDAARRRLAEDSRCTGKVGVIGFCQGGGFAVLCAARQDFQVASVSYGMLPRDLDRALQGACPIVASYGAKDSAMFRGSAAKLRTALDALGIDNDVKEYPDAGHSFMNHHTGFAETVVRVGRMGFREESARDGWQRITAFFEKHLR